jgi:hypothetical protein
MTLAYWLVDSFTKGLEYNTRAMDGHIERRSMEELNTLTTKRIMKNKK